MRFFAGVHLSEHPLQLGRESGESWAIVRVLAPAPVCAQCQPSRQSNTVLYAACLVLRAYGTLHAHTHCVPDGDVDHGVVLTRDFVEGGPTRRAWAVARSRVQLSDKVQGYIRFYAH